MGPTTRSQTASSCSPLSTTDDPLPSEMTATTTTTTSLSHEVGVTDTSTINSPIPVDQQPALVPLSLPNLNSPFQFIPQCLSSTPPPFQAATLAAFTYMQAQLATATHTISNMQAEINMLKEQLTHATQQITKNHEMLCDSEVRIKSTFKATLQEFTHELQELKNSHQKQQTKLHEHTNKLQSLKDSQQNFHTDTKKQLQSLSTPKQKQTTSSQPDSPKASPSALVEHSSDVSQTDSPKASPSALVEHSTDVSQTDSPKASPPAVADHSTDARYTVSVNNRYTALADSTDLEPVTPAFPPPPSPPLLPSPSRNNRNAPLKQGKAAPPQHRPATDLRRSPSGMTQQHAKAAPLLHRTATDPRPSPRHLMQQHSVPPDCNTLLLGDSIMRRVDEVKMSNRGARVRNLAVSGLTVADLCEWLSSLPPSQHIKHATFHVGINSCGEGPVSVASWRRLVSLHRRAFPQAVLQASSILPPFGQHPLTEAASRSTANLRQVCRAERVVYIDHTPSFLSPSGAPKRAMYRPGDRIHPSDKGARSVAMNILFAGGPQQPRQEEPIGPGQQQPAPRPRPLTNPWKQGHDPEQSPHHAGQPIHGQGLWHNTPGPCLDYKDFPPPTPRAPDAPEVTNTLGRRASPAPCHSEQALPDSVSVLHLLAQMLRPYIN